MVDKCGCNKISKELSSKALGLIVTGTLLPFLVLLVLDVELDLDVDPDDGLVAALRRLLFCQGD